MSPRIPARPTVRPALPLRCAAPGRSGRPAGNARRMRRLLFGAALALLVSAAMPGEAASQDFSRNGIYVEGSLSRHLYSVNYERRLSPVLVARTGVLMRTMGGGRVDVSTVPLMISLLDGFRRFGQHRLELGTGPLLGVVHRSPEGGPASNAVRGGFAVAAGYRYQPRGDGMLVRTGLTVLNCGGDVSQALHVGLGYAF